MTPLYTTSEIKLGEPIAAEKAHILMYELMQRAGKAAFECAEREYPLNHHFLVLCGRGNNAGDGYVFALHALNANKSVTVIQVESDRALVGDAGTAQHAYLSAGGMTLDAQAWIDRFPIGFQQGLYIDALLGTGLTRAPQGLMHQLIVQINGQPNSVLSLDVPSGLNADTGAIEGTCVHADRTITFVGSKPGLHTGKARNVCGTVEVNALGIEREFCASVTSSIGLYGSSDILSLLPKRHPTAHKGDAGKVLLCGGNEGMGGALMLAGKAAHRAGAGMVASLTHPQHVNAVLSFHPECMVSGWEGDKSHVESRLNWSDVIAIGPGLGQNDWWSRTLFSLVLKQLNQQFSDKCLVIDADALHFLRDSPKPNPNQVITPHPGEAAALLNCSVQAIEIDRLVAAKNLYNKYGGVIVLKGAGTVIYSDKQWAIINTGHQGMATAGMGDVLTGLIASCIAQGLSPMKASILGALIHGYAAQICEKKGIKMGLLASDLLTPIAQIVSQSSGIERNCN